MDLKRAVKNLTAGVILMTSLLVAVLILSFILLVNVSKTDQTGYGASRPEPVALLTKEPLQHDQKVVLLREPNLSASGRYKKAAVSANNGLCSEIGRDILVGGGNAVDAAIAAVMCCGVANLHSSGLGGGHFMTIYNRTTKSCTALDSRERAPFAADKDMFVGDGKAAQIDWKSIAVPGEVRGLWTAFERYGSGRVTWAQLLQPTILMVKNGFPISFHLAKILKRSESTIANRTSLRVLLNPETGSVYQEGEILRLPTLGETLQRLSLTNASYEFYQGFVARQLLADLEKHGAIITARDLEEYRTVIREPIYTNHPSGLTLCGPPPPSSSANTQAIINIMAGYNIPPSAKASSEEAARTLHRLVEAMKFAYASRSLMGDMDFVPEALLWTAQNLTTSSYAGWVRDKIGERSLPLAAYGGEFLPAEDAGTTHVSVLDADGNAVSITSTINRYFGAKVASEQTGILLNDQMDDFSTPNLTNNFGYPPSRANFISPGKRPQSSMSPIVLFDRNTGQVKLVIGAQGGSRIISSTASVATRALFMGESLVTAVDAPRLHNQLLPESTRHEARFSQDMVRRLTERGQIMEKKGVTLGVVQAILVGDDGDVSAVGDYRMGTTNYPAGY